MGDGFPLGKLTLVVDWKGFGCEVSRIPQGYREDDLWEMVSRWAN